MPDLFSSLFQNVQGGAGSASPGAEIFQPGLYPMSYSGMNPAFSSPMLSQIAPLLTQSLEQMPNSVASLMKTQGGGAIQQIMNRLGSNRMINSSVASDALGKGMAGMGGAVANAQTQMPQMLSQLMGNVGNFSYSSNPLAPYELLSNFTMGY